jgi:hypothetical protein
MSNEQEPRKQRRPWIAIVALLGVFGASGIVWQASNAAFTATTSDGVNTFSAGTVALTDNDTGTALFNASNLKPGSTGTACIRVTYSGSLTAGVRLYATGASGTNGLDTNLTLTVDEGTNSSGTAGTCGTWTTGTGGAGISTSSLNTFTGTRTSYATGAGTWNPAGPATKDYQITYTLSALAPNTVQGGTAQVTFVWEAQNT